MPTRCIPQLQASVGWLVDEENGGDWGLDIVCDVSPVGDYAPHQVAQLQKGLPSCFARFRKEVARKLSGTSRILANNMAKLVIEVIELLDSY